MGDHPLGRILYLDNGQMSAQVVASGLYSLGERRPGGGYARRSRPRLAQLRWILGHFHGGRPIWSRATHAVDGAWFPNWIGQRQVRQYRFGQTRSRWMLYSPAWHATLIWRRIE